jgi:predicted GIY-YIG superfamily endonuclease
MTTYRVYVLRNTRGRHYIGVSEDPEARLAQHNAGVSHWAGSNGPWGLAWISAALDLSGARQLENLLKRQKGGVGFYRITGLPGKSR